MQLSSAQKNKETEPAKIYNFPPTPRIKENCKAKNKYLKVKYKTSQNKPQ
jgi:hypothetical protein